MKKQTKKYLVLFEGSNILVHGHGSAGKAGFALKILSSPIHYLKGKSVDLFGAKLWPKISLSRRILVISFLYPASDYEDLMAHLLPLLRNKYNSNISAQIDCLAFSPGFLLPEDFYGIVLQIL